MKRLPSDLIDFPTIGPSMTQYLQGAEGTAPRRSLLYLGAGESGVVRSVWFTFSPQGGATFGWSSGDYRLDRMRLRVYVDAGAIANLASPPAGNLLLDLPLDKLCGTMMDMPAKIVSLATRTADDDATFDVAYGKFSVGDTITVTWTAGGGGTRSGMTATSESYIDQSAMTGQIQLTGGTGDALPAGTTVCTLTVTACERSFSDDRLDIKIKLPELVIWLRYPMPFADGILVQIGQLAGTTWTPYDTETVGSGLFSWVAYETGALPGSLGAYRLKSSYFSGTLTEGNPAVFLTEATGSGVLLALWRAVVGASEGWTESNWTFQTDGSATDVFQTSGQEDIQGAWGTYGMANGPRDETSLKVFYNYAFLEYEFFRRWLTDPVVWSDGVSGFIPWTVDEDVTRVLALYYQSAAGLETHHRKEPP